MNGARKPAVRRHASALLATLWLGFAPTLHAIGSAPEGGAWLDARGPLRLPVAPGTDVASLRVLIGQTDFGAQARVLDDGTLEIAGTPVRLPAGEHSATVYAVDADGGWRELVVQPVRVLSRGGFERGQLTPRLDLNNESQLRQRVSGTANAADPDEYYHLASTAGLATRHARDGWSLDSDWNLSGNSRREAALQFGRRGAQAPKFDLASYRIGLAGSGYSLAVGHVPLGRNPLLMDNVSTRGVVATAQPLPWADVQIGAVNGTSIVGFDRFFGVRTRDHLMTGMSLGVDAPTGGRGSLRVEISLTDSQLESESGFDIGQVPDREKSRGQGARLAYATPAGRFSLQALYARSRYDNPADAALALVGTPVAVREQTRDAQRAQFSWSPLSGVQIGPWALSLNLSGSHAQADPLYRTIGAFVSGDQRNDMLAASAVLGIAELSLSVSRARDNLDDIPSLLTTRTRGSSANLRLGLDQLVRNQAGTRSWLPALDLSHDRLHQYASNSPAFEDSDFNATSHLPDQITGRTGLGLSWTLGAAAFGYRLDLSDQNNRQPGRERADFFNRVHNFNLRLTPWQALSLELGHARSDNENREQALTQFNRSDNAAINWQISKAASLSARWFDSDDDDSLGLAESGTRSADAVFNLRWNLPVTSGRKVPVHFFLRYARQENEARDRVFGFASEGSNWTINSGVSATLF